MFSVVLASLVLGASAAPIIRQSLDFGSCSNPTIIFASGLDGRTEDAFEPANLVDFGHGSADNIGIISSFICQRLSDTCKASADAIAACATAETAAAAQTAGAAADAFNAALGFTTTFATTPGVGPAAADTTTGTSSSVASDTTTTTSSVAAAATTCAPPTTVTVTVTAAAAAATSTAAASSSSSTTTTSTAAASGDLNTFTGDLGSGPVAITAGGKGFIVNGDQFINLSAAVQRACSVQNNACADAANAGGNKAFTVADCSTQETACNAQ